MLPKGFPFHQFNERDTDNMPQMFGSPTHGSGALPWPSSDRRGATPTGIAARLAVQLCRRLTLARLVLLLLLFLLLLEMKLILDIEIKTRLQVKNLA